MRRAIVIVLDSFGVGAMPDASDFGDSDPDTFGNIYKSCGGINLPNLNRIGLSHIDGVSVPGAESEPSGIYARLAERSKGKDTVTGHWELMGIVSASGFKIYEHGFPEAFMTAVEKAWGVGFLGNAPASGTEIIKVLGDEHVKTGKPIVYTSADSVFQIAAHEDVIPLQKLYDMCETVRHLSDERNMGICRIIARPFTGGEHAGFTRTENRRDFCVMPPEKTVLERLAEAGARTLGIGKIEDIFAGRGLTLKDHSKNNEQGINATVEHLRKRDSEFIFTNLVDFDMLYGHRRDAKGYKNALEYFDRRLPEIERELTEDDILIITADHGCDPTACGTDHTREYVPMLCEAPSYKISRDLGTVCGLDFVGRMAEEWLTDGNLCFG